MHTDKDVAKFLLEHDGIRLQLSAPYVHSQNGQVERDMENILDRTRTMMSVYDTPTNLWEFAIEYASLLINYSPTSNEDFKTPWEVVTGEKPNLSNLIPFYAPGVYHITKAEMKGNKNITTYKAMPCRMLGFPRTSPKNYLILSVKNRTILSRYSCRFDDNYLRKTIDNFENIDVSESDDGYLEVEDVDEEVESTEIETPSNIEIYESNDNIEYNDEVVKPALYLDENTNEDSGEDLPIQENRSVSIDGSTDSETNSDCFACDQDLPYRKDLSKDAHIQSVHLSWMEDVACTVLNLTLPLAPKSIQEALDHLNPDREKWWQAIHDELSILDDQKTFSNCVQQGRGMKTKFIFTTSFKNDFSIKYKARLVVQGYSQIYGVDYMETFSPTVPIMIVFMLLHIAKSTNKTIAIFDVTGAFLEGENDFEQYCWIPAQLCPGNVSIRLRIMKSLYGQKQAPKIWNDRLNHILVEMGFTRCPVCPCLYSNIKDKSKFYVCVHVDDGLMIADNIEAINEFMKILQTHVKKATLFFPIKKYLGMELTETNKHVQVFQKYYIDELKSIEINDVPTFESIPMSPTANLRLEKPDTHLPSMLPIIGKLRYVADRTRPDVLASVGEISCNGSPHPSMQHMKTAKQIVNYLKSTSDRRLTLGGDEEIKLFAFSDASHITCGNSRGRLGGCMYLGRNSGAFYSFSKLSNTVSHSSAEVEIKALDYTMRTIIFVREILDFLTFKQVEPTVIYVDSASTMELCKTLKSSENVRHINMRINYLRECINSRQIILKFVPTDENTADTLTKALSFTTFEKFTQQLLSGFNGQTFQSHPQQQKFKRH
jgi:hypothetical protein